MFFSMAGIFTRIATIAAILSMTLGVLLAQPEAADARLWQPDANECAFLHSINLYRRSHGVSPLLLSRSLSMAADYHSNYMARTDDVDHSLAGGASWSQSILNFGYPEGYGMGENVLAGRSSAGGALTLWSRSPAHNDNMLNSSWKAIGIGRAVNLDGRYKYYWTTTFGTVRHRTISC
jgi:uncharacterized protein YkwD